MTGRVLAEVTVSPGGRRETSHRGASSDVGEPLDATCAAAFPGHPRIARLDASVRAALVAARRACELAGSGDVTLLLVVVPDGSAAADRAYWRTAADAGGVLASPLLFAATLPSAAGGEIAATLGLRGACLVTLEEPPEGLLESWTVPDGAPSRTLVVTIAPQGSGPWLARARVEA